MSEHRHRHRHLPSRRTTILDGGIGHELKVRGVSDGTFVAGLLANESRPDTVEGVHRDYRSAGCEVLTTNSFVAVPMRMVESHNLASDGGGGEEGGANRRAAELIVASVERAREAAGPTGLTKVAGCVPPLTECYVASEVPDGVDGMVRTYHLILSTLIDAGVDVLLAETLSTSREGLAIVRALSDILGRTGQNRSVPLWISFTIDDYKPLTLRSGEELRSAVTSVLRAATSSGVDLRAIGVNCASPRAISEAVPRLVSVAESGGSEAPPEVMAYGNAFRTTTSDWLRSVNGGAEAGRSDSNGNGIAAASSLLDASEEYDESGCMFPEVYARYTERWVGAGASIVGGCCGCGPRHMSAVVGRLRPPTISTRMDSGGGTVLDPKI